MDECKPLVPGRLRVHRRVAAHAARRAVQAPHVRGRGLHSSTFQLNLSASYGIGDALRDCEADVKGVLGGV